MGASWPQGVARHWRGLAVAAALTLLAPRVSATTAYPYPAPPATRAAAVGLAGVRFGGDAITTRVVLDLDASVAARILAGESSPTRLVIGLPALLTTGPMQGQGRGFVTRWTLQDTLQGARLILDVAPGATATHRFLIPPAVEGGAWRYVIDIRGAEGDAVPPADLAASRPSVAGRPVALAAAAAIPEARPWASRPTVPGAPASAVSTQPRQALAMTPSSDRARPDPSADPASRPPFVRVATAVEPDPAPGPPPTLRPDAGPTRTVGAARTPGPRAAAARGLKVIVVDAGHGGHDPGARSLVRNEKDITLATALALKARLERMGRYRVVLTRDTDVFIPLETRVQIARRAGADLFISLHADSAGTDPTPHGASVYTLSDSGQSRVNYVLGPHEWFSHAGDRRTDPGVRQILLDLTQRSTRNRSSQFASILIDHIGDRVDLLPRSHRDAGYFVLLAPDVPAVLLEMGFITNPADEMRLTDPEQREKLASGVADAIDAYFSGGTRLAAG